MGSTTACVIGLTWGGVQFAWASPRVLVPLIVGLIGIVAFMIFEAKIPKEPLVSHTVLLHHDGSIFDGTSQIGSTNRSLEQDRRQRIYPMFHNIIHVSKHNVYV